MLSILAFLFGHCSLLVLTLVAEACVVRRVFVNCGCKFISMHVLYAGCEWVLIRRNERPVLAGWVLLRNHQRFHAERWRRSVQEVEKMCCTEQNGGRNGAGSFLQ